MVILEKLGAEFSLLPKKEKHVYYLLLRGYFKTISLIIVEHCALKATAESREPQDFHVSSKSLFFFSNLDESEETSGYMFEGVSLKLESCNEMSSSAI